MREAYQMPVRVEWRGKPPSTSISRDRVDHEVAVALESVSWKPNAHELSRVLGLPFATAYDRMRALFHRRNARLVLVLDGEDPYERIAELEAKMARMVSVECRCGATLYSISSRRIGSCSKCSRNKARTARK
jgi:hypothetical protein